MRSFRSSSGKTILVGRDARDNNYLTLKVAQSHDLWLHASDFPGSHVVIQLGDDEEASRQDIEEAARLAAHFSKGKNRDAVKVDYTLKSNVTKLRKAPAGQVEITDHKTIKVKKDATALQAILDQELL